MEKCKIFITFIVLLISTAVFSEEKYQIIREKVLPNNLGTFREIEFDTNNNQSAIFYTVILNKNYHAMLHMHESKEQSDAAYLDELNQQHHFIVGINGGFYQSNFMPVGLFIYHGNLINNLTHSSLFKSCVVVNKNNKIILETELNECSKASNAMQTGPLLIKDGKINTELENLKNKSDLLNFFDAHKRTLLALTNENNIILLTASSLGLMDVANFLAHFPNALGTSQIKTAINLDGGSSTGMYIQFPDEPFYLHELKHVKTFIFIN